MNEKIERPLKKLAYGVIFLMVGMLVLGISTCGCAGSPSKGKQTQGRNNLKQIGINMMAYLADHADKPGAKFPPLSDSPDGLLAEGLPATDPFFTTNYVYSEQVIEGYLLKEGERLPPSDILHKVLNPKVNLIIVEGAKEICEDRLMKYAPITSYCLRGDMSVNDEN